MGNTIAVTPHQRDDVLSLSNGATDALLALVCLVGAERAANPQHERLLIWLASHDQNVLGRGCVGFDLCDMPWSAGGFEEERTFLVEVVRAAAAGAGWTRLPFEPDVAIMSEKLSHFERLLPRLRPEDLARGDDEPPLGWPDEHLMCPVHRVFLHTDGCLICHMAP